MKCYICENPVEWPDAYTQSRLWVIVPITTPCGKQEEVAAHMGCMQLYKQVHEERMRRGEV